MNQSMDIWVPYPFLAIINIYDYAWTSVCTDKFFISLEYIPTSRITGSQSNYFKTMELC